MKNQYFGDTRDLFKYDLILELLLKTNLNHFTFIPMLTKNEKNTNGRRINYRRAKAGTKRTTLRSFLEKCLEEDRRRIEELERFFRGSKLTKKMGVTIFGKNRYFSDENREQYFESIKADLLKGSVILVDPDVGLELKNTKGRAEKYVKYKEIIDLHNHMDKDSILLIFQFIPRVEREKYFYKIGQKILEVTVKKDPVLFISDNQIVFFILIKDLRLLQTVARILVDYANTYGLKIGRVTGVST